MLTKLLFLLTALFFTAGAANAQNDDKKIYRAKTLVINGAEFEVQALVLDSGKITLFKVIDYYLEINTGSQIITILLVKERKEYKSQLSQSMADCPAVAKEISKTKFNSDDLTRVVRLYNSCQALNTKELYSPTFTANVGVGLSLIGGSIKSSDDNTKKLNWSFKPAAAFYLTAALIPPRKKNISLGVEASFANRKMEGYSQERSGIYTNETFLNVQYNQFTTAFQFVHYIKTRKHIQPFYCVAVGRVFTSQAKTELWNIDSYGPNVFAIKNSSGIMTQNCNQFSLLAGAKTQIKTNYKIVFELRFDLQPNQIYGDRISKSLTYSITPTLRIVMR